MSTEGVCSICLETKDLSFDHTPPEKAFNSSKVIAATFDHMMSLHPWETITEGRVNQRGAGFSTVCRDCNSLTGKLYAREYIDWCRQAHRWLERSRIDPRILPIFAGFPLRVLKQAATMMLAMHGPVYTRAHPDLQRFVREEDRRYMGKDVRMFAYYNTSPNLARYSGGPHFSGGLCGFSVFSEIAKYPFGFVLSENGTPPDPRLVDISELSRFGYRERAAWLLQLPIFPVASGMAGMFGIYFDAEEVGRMSDPVIGPLDLAERLRIDREELEDQDD